MREHLKINILCGQYSYKNITKSEIFDIYMGVTGTLPSSDDAVYKQIIEDQYNIRKATIMPTMFAKFKT